MAIVTGTYQGHDVVIEEETVRLNYGRVRQMAYVRLLDGARILGTPGMWGGCEQAAGWVESDAIHNRRVEQLPDDLPIAADPRDDEPEPVDFAEARAWSRQVDDMQMTGRGA